jgi:hypothetical protein
MATRVSGVADFMKPASLPRALGRWVLIGVGLMSTVGVIGLVLSGSDEPVTARDASGYMFVQVGVGATMGVLIGLLTFTTNRHGRPPPTKPTGTAYGYMVRKGLVYGLIATALLRVIGLEWPAAIATGVLMGVVIGGIARVGYERNAHDYEERLNRPD